MSGTPPECESFYLLFLWLTPQANFRSAFGTKTKCQQNLDKLNDKQLLWVNILERDEEIIKHVTQTLHLEKVPMKGILRISERPKIFKFKEFYHEIVDRMDDRILQKDMKDEEFLNKMIRLRRDVSRLRKWFLPHRDIFYALSRPDFKRIAESDSFENFQELNSHFESAVGAIESSRDTVLSLFDLFTTKSSHNMNNQIRRLTFITLIVGGLGAIAGVWGMNFEVEYFKAAETGFWLTMIAMGVYILLAMLIGKLMRWF